ncbi:MAG TPA: histidine triad nucleotide-binding protein [Spirochaetota bacterium]|nr:histidine triad nucleotide-binding protein [Spirochaetota bacterium]
MGCLFCNIIAGEIPSTKIFENERVFAFADISPQAPVHALVVHKTHITNLDELTAENSGIMADLFLGVKEVARITGVDAKGYRVIINNGAAGGQVIWHLHVHVLGGRDDMGPMVVK